MKVYIFIIFLYSILLTTAVAGLPLRGQGDYKWLFLHIYEAKLWAEKGDNIYSRPLLLELKYSRSFKGKDIVEQSIKELTNTGSPKLDIEKWRESLLKIFPDVKEGDVIQAKYDPVSGVVFSLNLTKELGRISDPHSSKTFLDIWLGENTSDPELRKILLGQNL